MPGTTLAAPASTDELYLARAHDIAPGRPLLTGDVLTDVDLDADDHGGIAMIVAHPCSMRGREGRLVPRIVVAPIRPYQNVPFARWPDGHFKVMPLLALWGDGDDPRAVYLLELSAVRSEALAHDHRVLALTHRGSTFFSSVSCTALRVSR